MSQKYTVSHQGQAQSPSSLDEIVNKVKAKELDLFDYIFDEAQGDWVLLMEFSPLAERVKSNKPPRPPQTTNATQEHAAKEQTKEATLIIEPAHTLVQPDPAHQIAEWYVLKAENRFGPFGYTDLVKMLQQKVLFPFDYVWNAGFENWKRVAEIDDFRSERIRDLYSAATPGKAIFVERKFQRKQFTARVIVHDNLSLWKGEGFEISQGGVGITMGNSLVIPGQQVHVHFKPHDSWPAFNAICEVVSKKFVNDQTPIQYGMRFLSLSQEVQEEFLKKVA